MFLGLALIAVAGQSAGADSVGADPAQTQAAAKNIPPSQDKMWPLLRHTRIDLDFKHGVYTATHPPEVQALVGKTVTVQGFVLPYKAETEFRHFLLTPYSPGCPFCPPANPNEIIDVTVGRPIKAEERQFVVTGKFATQNNGKDGLFFRLDDATAE